MKLIKRNIPENFMRVVDDGINNSETQTLKLYYEMMKAINLDNIVCCDEMFFKNNNEYKNKYIALHKKYSGDSPTYRLIMDLNSNIIYLFNDIYNIVYTHKNPSHHSITKMIIDSFNENKNFTKIKAKLRKLKDAVFYYQKGNNLIINRSTVANNTLDFRIIKPLSVKRNDSFCDISITYTSFIQSTLGKKQYQNTQKVNLNSDSYLINSQIYTNNDFEKLLNEDLNMFVKNKQNEIKDMTNYFNSF